MSIVLLGLVLIGSLLEAWKIYKSRHECTWKNSSNFNLSYELSVIHLYLTKIL